MSAAIVQPAIVSTALVDGDLCEMRVGRRYCGQEGVVEAVDADGTVRVLCAEHRALLFPTEVAV